MSAMEINKIVAALLLSLLVAMGAGFFARFLIPSPIAQHVEKEIQDYAYLPDEAADEAGISVGDDLVTEDEGLSILQMIAQASPEAGEKIAKKCIACHSFERGGAKKIGPNLYDIVGTNMASRDFVYSKALTEQGGTWSYEALNNFLKKPSAYIPGTKMSFVGLRKDVDRAAIIAYLRMNTENPPQIEE